MTPPAEPSVTGTPTLPTFTDVPPGDGGEPGFRLAVVPTTARQYAAHLADTGLDTRPDPALHGFPSAPGFGLRATPTGIVLDEPYADLPVTWVTWHGAVAYCAWLAERTGTPVRLPTAAQWYRAAAGPARWRWSLSDSFDRPVYAPASTGPRPVPATAANPYGLHDLTGNVFEWCADELTGLPGDAPSGSRALKGGAWTVRNPESFENRTTFSADACSAVPYIGFRVLS